MHALCLGQQMQGLVWWNACTHNCWELIRGAGHGGGMNLVVGYG